MSVAQATSMAVATVKLWDVQQAIASFSDLIIRISQTEKQTMGLQTSLELIQIKLRRD